MSVQMPNLVKTPPFAIKIEDFQYGDFDIGS